MNAGKVMEQQFKKSVAKHKDVFYYRFRDGTASFYGGQNAEGIRFQSPNICDIMLFKSPTLFLLELKSHKGKSFPLSAIRKGQIDGLIEASQHKNICAGFVIDMTDVKRCFYVSASAVVGYSMFTSRKSIPLEWMEQNGVEIPLVYARTHHTYDLYPLWKIEVPEKPNESEVTADEL